MKRFAAVLGVWALALAVLAPAASATEIVYRTPRQLGQLSAMVVDGTVTGVRSYWNDAHSKIITEADVRVSDTHKGPSASTVRVVQLGGVVGNVRMTVHGAVAWKTGEEVLLFLEPALPGTYQVAGLSEGKYTVERDPRSGKAYVSATGGGAHLVASPGQAAPANGKMPLDDFINQVFGHK